VISRARLRFLQSLHRRKAREEERLLLVEGYNLVEEAVRGGGAKGILLRQDAAASERGRALARAGPPVELLDEGDASKLADTETPSGVFAVVEDPCRPFATARLPATALLLVAAGVSDPGNLGTLVRTAAALGAAAVVATPGTVEPTNPKAVRASAGALFRIPVLLGDAEEVKAAGFRLLLADAGGVPAAKVRSRTARLALAVGSEPHGFAGGVKALADGAIAVPLSRGVESLNVAVAAGILLHHLASLPVSA
jgi:TrmH family RNA methyltransferase